MTRYPFGAVAALVAAVKAEFTSPETEGGPAPSADHEAVSASIADGETVIRESLITFGLIRAAERELMTGTPLPESTTVQRFKVEPGDVVVVTFPDRLPREAHERVEAWLRSAIGPEPKVLVLEGGAKLDLLSLAIGDRLAEPFAVPHEACGGRGCEECGGLGSLKPDGSRVFPS